MFQFLAKNVSHIVLNAHRQDVLGARMAFISIKMEIVAHVVHHVLPALAQQQLAKVVNPQIL